MINNNQSRMILEFDIQNFNIRYYMYRFGCLLKTTTKQNLIYTRNVIDFYTIYITAQYFSFFSCI